jgi:hypothetical protein
MADNRNDVKLVDTSEVSRNLAAICAMFPDVADKLVRTIANQILAQAQQLCPVYEGPPYRVRKPGQSAIAHVGGYLRSTLYLKPLGIGEWEIGASAEYAAAQHEHTEWVHSVPGKQAKYIETPLLRFALGEMPRHLAERLLADLRKGMT